MQNLLIVSDNTNIINSLKKIFNNTYNTSTASADLTHILNASSTHQPDKIIVECKEYDTVKSILKDIKEVFSNVPTVLISSFLSNKDISEISNNNIVASYIIKPCSKKQILESIEDNKSIPKINIDSRIIVPIIEAYGSKNSVLVRTYSRICGFISRVEDNFDYDFTYVHHVLSYYIITITTLDEDLITDLLSGTHSRKEAIPYLVEQIKKIINSSKEQLPNFNPKTLTDMLYINKKYNGKGLPLDGIVEDKLPYTSRLLRILFDFHYLQERGKSIGECFFILGRRKGWYDQSILTKIINGFGEEALYYNREVFPLGLENGMIMAQNLYGTIKGKKILLLKDGQKLTNTNIDYIHRHAQDILDVTEPILIREKISVYEDENA